MDLLNKVQVEDLDKGQRTLTGLIGIEAFRVLVRNHNGAPVYTPKIGSLGKPVRDELTREEFDGRSYRELALKYGSTETWVRNIVMEEACEIRVRPIDGQISLKGILY